MLNLNLSNEEYYGTSRSIYSNVTDIYGTTYPSVYTVVMDINGTYYQDFFAGNFSTDASGAVTGGTVSAYYEYEWNGSAWVLADSVRGFAYSAVAFYDAAVSGSQSQTTSIEGNILSGYNSIYGGGQKDVIYAGGSGNTVYDSNSTVYVNSPQTWVNGGGNYIDLLGADDAVSLYNTSGGNWDWVDGSNSSV